MGVSGEKRQGSVPPPALNRMPRAAIRASKSAAPSGLKQGGTAGFSRPLAIAGGGFFFPFPPTGNRVPNNFHIKRGLPHERENRAAPARRGTEDPRRPERNRLAGGARQHSGQAGQSDRTAQGIAPAGRVPAPGDGARGQRGKEQTVRPHRRTPRGAEAQGFRRPAGFRLHRSRSAPAVGRTAPHHPDALRSG